MYIVYPFQITITNCSLNCEQTNFVLVLVSNQTFLINISISIREVHVYKTSRPCLIGVGRDLRPQYQNFPDNHNNQWIRPYGLAPYIPEIGMNSEADWSLQYSNPRPLHIMPTLQSATPQRSLRTIYQRFVYYLPNSYFLIFFSQVYRSFFCFSPRCHNNMSSQFVL